MQNKVSVAVLTVSFALSFVVPLTAFAATSPDLLTAGTFGVLSSTFNANVLNTAVTGDVGYVTLGGSGTITVSGATQINNAARTQAGTDAGLARTNLMGQPCISLGTAVDLNAVTIGGYPTGTFPPGCYSSSGAMNIVTGTTVTLSGVGTYIFKPDAAITTGANSIVKLADGASSCDVFWTPNGDTTLGANSTFIGTDIPVAQDIYVGNLASWIGRALSFGHVVTTDTNTINTACSVVAAISSGGPRTGNINVVKTVINDNGGTKTVADFPLFVNSTLVASGATNAFPAPAPAYTVTETSNVNYSQSFSGGCDSDGRIALSPGDNKICIVTNNDIGAPAVPPVPPLIDMVKTANPLSLPAGPGTVVYTYTLRNVGTVPVTNITIVGDTCSPILLTSGDTNANAKLEVNETWVHTCTQTLSATHTNTAVATGWANGISATDIASATVVVGASIVPPLIHVAKIPSVFTLLAGGGPVTYMYIVTNPGTAPLSNVSITDNKCTGLPGRVVGHPGDLNRNNLLESNESWIFTCKSNLTQTTTNIGTVEGSANGLTARDLALATVVVASPRLPNTGLSPEQKPTPWYTAIFSFLQGLHFF